MKKIALILLALVFISSVSFAQTATGEKKTAGEELKTAVGNVVSVTVAEPTKGIAEGAVTIADNMGKTATFTVKSTAKILDAALNVVTLNQLKKGEKVEVKHSKTEAKSINVVK